MSGDQPQSDPLATVSSLASGDGSSASPLSATTKWMASSTSPGSPCDGVNQREGKTTISTQTLSFCVNTFSSKTCLELLIDDKLSLEQIQHEANYLSSLGHGRIARVKDTLTPQTRNHIVNDVRAKLANSVCIDYQAAEQSHQLTLNNFSYLIEQAQKEVDKLVNLNTAAKNWSPDTPDFGAGDSIPPQESTPDPHHPDTDKLPETVCDFDVESFDTTISITQVLNQIPITEHSSCGRKVAYFGAKGYNYGNVNHPPKDYPNCEVMNQILHKMRDVDPNFNKDDFSCLVTLYPDGRATIPAHSDDENQIHPDSKIWTLSFGATRVIEFVRRTGVLQEFRVPLHNGQLFSMTAKSQSDWSHELLYEPNLPDPRVSFTFRHIVDPPAKSPAPPMLTSAPKPGRKQKILFLTDSVLYSTPEFLFDRVPNHRCIKKRNYYFADVPKFEPDFINSQIVLLSLGINDLSTCSPGRPQKSGEELAAWVSHHLNSYCKKYRNTVFLVNSILHTRHSWLNSEIDTYNQVMYLFAQSIPNLQFVDSHTAITRHGIARRIDFVLDRYDGRGTHLTLDAKKIVARELVAACQSHASSSKSQMMKMYYRNT
ncbi:hypothetical protein ACHWQZ_G002226 [Mnemiopsis leidyi]